MQSLFRNLDLNRVPHKTVFKHPRPSHSSKASSWRKSGQLCRADVGGHSVTTPLLLCAEVNDLTGIIPDNFDSTSHLRVLTAWGNALTGPIPKTLGLVPNMEVRVYICASELASQRYADPTGYTPST